ncbi:hypothetical protein ABIC28_003720 [Rhodococcus sp. PvR044]|jgi:hypothetical protein|uniref:type IV toxin-antitoxin system AbiEi family antitoxin domain-containing protein n=1 Tax=Rhodococcus TaxID=1827 RepID=UPI0022B34048|nr:type IV toxin-antitoxin system AbiEi family antitoxin domain-containing protein [Rhodococcus maanshanensis]MCZ4556337.1 type IV toxin-antitoxin system AbiEi family antitoxin domain-containing protein [Rhodococcus maanshanensis]
MSNATDLESLEQLLGSQDGLLSAAQAHRSGYTRKHVQYLLESGQWQRPLHGVYAVTTGPLSRPMLLRAALLYGGVAMLSHDTAAEEWGLLPLARGGPVHITVPYGSSAVNQYATAIRRPPRAHEPVPSIGELLHPGVIVHRSRAFSRIGVETEPPRTSPPDTAIDLAVDQPTARLAYGSVVASVTNGGIRLSRLQSRIVDRKPRRYNRAIADACSMLANGIQSVLEFHYAVDVERAHGLPDAVRQGPVTVDGVTLYEDVTYTGSAAVLVVRLDGHRWHSSRKVRRRDRRRSNAASLAGRDQLVFGWEEVNEEPCLVAAEVRALLERGGWRGANPCPNCARFIPQSG